VHQGKPYTDKPRLFLDRGDFEQEDTNAYFRQGNAIYRREGGLEAHLTSQNGQFLFENAQVRLTVSVDEVSGEWEIEEGVLQEPWESTVSLREAAEMAVLLNGIGSSLPFLWASR
jgi:hypothetical protein